MPRSGFVFKQLAEEASGNGKASFSATDLCSSDGIRAAYVHISNQSHIRYCTFECVPSYVDIARAISHQIHSREIASSEPKAIALNITTTRAHMPRKKPHRGQHDAECSHRQQATTKWGAWTALSNNTGYLGMSFQVCRTGQP